MSWGKLRSRRSLVAAMLPSTRELLRHMCQLSGLGEDDVAARTRARRARRLLKVCKRGMFLFSSRRSHLHATGCWQSGAHSLLACTYLHACSRACMRMCMHAPARCTCRASQPKLHALSVCGVTMHMHCTCPLLDGHMNTMNHA